MGTVFRMGSWRVLIYTHDHAPAHVHLVGPEGRAKIALNCPNGPVVPIEARGVDAGTLREALPLIDVELAVPCATWSSMHGAY